MKRRDFLKVTGIGAAGAATLAAPAIAQSMPELKWRLAASWPKSLDTLWGAVEHMAKLGNGCAAYLGPRDDAGEVMRTFFERISHPAMTDLAIDFGGLQVSEAYPQRIPDLFVGRPVVITGRYSAGGEHVISVKGMIGGEKRVIPMNVNFDDAANAHAGIGAHVDGIITDAMAGNDPKPGRIGDGARRHRLGADQHRIGAWHRPPRIAAHRALPSDAGGGGRESNPPDPGTGSHRF